MALEHFQWTVPYRVGHLAGVAKADDPRDVEAADPFGKTQELRRAVRTAGRSKALGLGECPRRRLGVGDIP